MTTIKILKYLKSIRELSYKEHKSLQLKLVKLAEEHGEVASAFLKGDRENLLEELLDTLLVVLSMVYELQEKENINDEVVFKTLEKKINKWKTQIIEVNKKQEV